MHCEHRHGSYGQRQISHGCCCGSQGQWQQSGMWSKKKKIRFLEAQLKDLNDQKTNIEELVEELSGKS